MVRRREPVNLNALKELDKDCPLIISDTNVLHIIYSGCRPNRFMTVNWDEVFPYCSAYKLCQKCIGTVIYNGVKYESTQTHNH